MQITVIATPVPPPPPWRAGWEARRPEIPDFPGRLYIARAPAGTDIPTPNLTRVIRPGWRPCPSTRQVEMVRSNLKANALGASPELAETAAAALHDPLQLAAEAERAIGVPHRYTWCAPVELSLEQAIRTTIDADFQWSSATSCGVIRAALAGYQVWTGVGSYMRHAGIAGDLDAAEDLAVQASRAQRRRAAGRILDILADWSLETPHQGARLADLLVAIERMPLSIRRGPIAGGGHSSELPIVATWRAGVFERHDVTITWDDERDRSEMRARRVAGEKGAAEIRAQRAAQRP